MNKNNKGNAIAQYGIIILLVSIAIIPGFFLIGKNLTDYFTSFKNMISGGDAQTASNSGFLNIFSGPGSSSSNTAENVEVSCEGTNCTIQVGNLVLNSIPENLTEIIETSGSAGGTETLASIIQQIADQADQNNINQKDAYKINKLASLAYELAASEKFLETFSGDVIRDFEAIMTQFDENYYYSLSNYEREQYVQSVIEPAIINFRDSYFTDENGEQFLGSFAQLLSNSNSGSVLAEAIVQNYPSIQTEMNKRTQFDYLLKDLTSDTSTLNSQTKAILSTLGGDIQLLADNMVTAFDSSIMYSDQQMDNLIADMSAKAHYDSYMFAMEYEMSAFKAIKESNDGLTSETTNLKAKIIDVTADSEENAKPEDQEDQETEETEDNEEAEDNENTSETDEQTTDVPGE